MNIKNKFILQKTEFLPEYRSTALHYKHIASHAQVLVLENDDAENLFSFGFRTPSLDDTGVAHILEHSVLAGSKNFPIKDPFLSMIKSSMQTFLNAMTYPDKTLYPAASTVEKDFFNLMQVYGDAVFFPLLKEETFWQEGFRLTWNAESQKLEPAGVVFNEMKGAYSSIDNFAFDVISQSLCPTTSYRYDSGGNPEHIPTLTHEQLLKFHASYYDPSNCKIFLYGNIDTEKKLAFLDEHFLQHFSNETADLSVIHNEPTLPQPLTLIKEFPAPDAADDQGMATVNWLTCDLTDGHEVLALEVLGHILLGASGAPFYAALQQSPIGQDLANTSGFSFDFKQAIFSAGVRGVKGDEALQLEALVLNTLQTIVNEGIPAQDIESALRAVEFSRRELRSGPVGLRLMSRLYKAWNYDQDPITALSFNTLMEELRRKATTPRYFEGLIERYLLNNQHRTSIWIRPNHELYLANETAAAERLAALQAKMTDEQIQQIKVNNQQLAAFQEATDDPTIAPKLSRADTPKQVSTIDTLVQPWQNCGNNRLIRANVFTNGLFYWHAGFEIRDLDAKALQWLPLFCRAVTGLGWPGVSYEEASRTLARDAGDLNLVLDTGDYLENGEAKERSVMLWVRFKALENQLTALPQVVRKALFQADFSDKDRLKALFWELYNDLKNSVVPSGSGIMALRLSRLYGASGQIEELWHGIDQLLFLESLKNELENDHFWQEIEKRFSEFRTTIFSAERVQLGYACEPTHQEQAQAVMNAVFGDLPHDASTLLTSAVLPAMQAEAEGWQAQTQVNYVGFSMPASAFNSPHRPAETLLMQHLTAGPLWEMVRMHGGAYGVSASVTGMAGYMIMTSYRDPHIEQTLHAFRQALNTFILLSERECDDLVIARLGKEHRPMGPQESLTLAMKRTIYGIGTVMRQRLRDELLAVSPQDLVAAATRLLLRVDEAQICVLGQQKNLETAQKSGVIKQILVIPH